MDNLFNYIVNLSPLILLFILMILDISIIKHKEKMLIVSYFFMLFFSCIYQYIIIYTYGDLFKAILSEIIIVVFLILFLRLILEKGKKFQNFIFLLIYGILIMMILYSFYYRLKAEDIIKIKIIDDIINKAKKIDYIDVFIKIINQPWTIAIFSPIIIKIIIKIMHIEEHNNEKNEKSMEKSNWRKNG